MKNNEKYKSWKLIPFTTLHCYSTPHCIPCVTILKAFTCYIVKFGFFLVLPYVCLCFYVSHHIYLQPHSKILSCTCAICMLWTHHLKDSLQQTNICIKTPKLMWNIIRIRIFSFPNSKQKHFKNQRSAKKMCSFFESCCMRCDVTGKYIHCDYCENTPTSKASCRKILFEIGPGCIYYEKCIDCCKKLKIKFDRSRHFYSEYYYTNYFLKKYFWL
jgi:hypothetical protein